MKTSTAALLGLGLGVIGMGAPSYALISKSIGVVDNQRELIGTQGDLIEALEGTNSILAETLTLQKEMAELELENRTLTKEGLEALYPEFMSIDEMVLSNTERENLTQTLDSSLNVDRAEVSVNLCLYEKVLFYGDDLAKIYGGNCIFVSPSLVLTNYHVVSSDLEGEFYTEISRVSAPSGEEHFVDETLAISPRYDLALVRVKNPNNKVVRLSVGDLGEDVQNIDLYSCGNGDFTCFGGNPTQEQLTVIAREDDIFLPKTGVLRFPSVEVEERLPPGYSGSPVFEDGRLVGLIAQSSQDSSYVTDNVTRFLQNVLHSASD